MLHLRRIVSSESWVPEIDGLRFVAILAVMLFHCSGESLHRGPRPLHVGGPLLQAIAAGDRGVWLFFVLSGFVLARPFYHQHVLGGRRVGLARYYLRRITRLEPPFLLCLAIYFVAWTRTSAMPLGLLVRHTAASAFYLHNLLLHGPPIPAFVTWSLEIEVQFYLVAPLLGQLFRIRPQGLRRSLLVALMLAGCLWSGFAPHARNFVFAGFFASGYLLAEIFDDPALPFRRNAQPEFRWDVLGLLCWLPIFLLPYSTALRGLLPLLIVPAYLLVFRGRVSRWLFSHPLLTSVGGMCYSLYLLHPLVMAVAFRAVRHVSLGRDAATWSAQVLLLLAAILPAGLCYFVLIERPCMRKDWPRDLVAWMLARSNRPARQAA